MRRRNRVAPPLDVGIGDLIAMSEKDYALVLTTTKNPLLLLDLELGTIEVLLPLYI